jgi:hypothetical protein
MAFKKTRVMIIRHFQNLFQSGTSYQKYDSFIIQIDKSFISLSFILISCLITF